MWQKLYFTDSSLKHLFSDPRPPSPMLQRFTDTLLKPIRSLTGGEVHPPDSIAVAHAFIADFHDKYCHDREEEKEIPPFSPFKWDDVLRSSQRDGKFVIIYLHSSMHDDTDAFCRDALLDARMLEFLHSNEVLVWGADVRHRDGSEVAGYLKACSFPFMAVCMKHRQSGSLMVLDRVEGIASLGDDAATSISDKLLDRLRSVAAANAQVVTQVRDDRRAEQERRTFIDQQNRDYEETLLADRERVRVGVVVVVLFFWFSCFSLFFSLFFFFPSFADFFFFKLFFFSLSLSSSLSSSSSSSSSSSIDSDNSTRRENHKLDEMRRRKNVCKSKKRQKLHFKKQCQCHVNLV